MGKLNEGNATLITCCSAMRQCMLSGDEMIVAPTGKKNVSTKMKIRYYLNDLDSRESAYIPIAKYSILMESKISSKQEWKQLSDYMKSRLGISLIFVNHQGKVKEYR